MMASDMTITFTVSQTNALILPQTESSSWPNVGVWFGLRNMKWA